jgi:hypothetical protein
MEFFLIVGNYDLLRQENTKQIYKKIVMSLKQLNL